MSTLASVRGSLQTGDRVAVTNHYITAGGDPDHPCYGTNVRTVTSVTRGGLWLDHERIPWPRTSAFRGDPDRFDFLPDRGGEVNAPNVHWPEGEPWISFEVVR